MRGMRYHGGFSLIELMAVLFITSILATLAWPAYSDYIRRSALEEATSALAAYAQRMNTAYDSNGNYGASACAVTLPASTSRWGFSCSLSNSGQGFTATAAGTGIANGHTFTTNHAGARATTAYGGASVAKNCWLIRGTEC